MPGDEEGVVLAGQDQCGRLRIRDAETAGAAAAAVTKAGDRFVLPQVAINKVPTILGLLGRECGGAASMLRRSVVRATS